MVNRRDFLSAVTLASVGSITRRTLASPESNPREVVVAAIQYAPVMGDVDSNLSRAERLILDAIRQNAKWIVLPEFFTSGLAVHPLMFDAVRPIDGAPTRFLKQIAKKHGVYIGGSFLAWSGKDVFNTFVLATPNGTTLTHDKDFPSFSVESSFYAAGDDKAYVQKLRDKGCKTSAQQIQPRHDNHASGVLVVDDHRVGVALCWELVRYETTRRLLAGKVELLLGASGWWWSSPEFDWPGSTTEEVAADRDKQLDLIREAPRRQARMLGVPVVHANFVGINPSFESTDFDGLAMGRYLGQSQVVDATGKSIGLLGEKEERALVETVELGPKKPIEPVPKLDFWMPEVNDGARTSWASSGAKGRDYYLSETRKRIHNARIGKR